MEGRCRILPLGVPAPKRAEPPARIRINYPAPTVDGGRYPAKRTVGDTVAHLRRHLPRRPRDPARGRSLQGARRPPLAGGADASGRRPHQRRPLGGRDHGRDPGPLGVDDRGLERPVRHLARRAPAQARRRAGRPRRRDLRGRRDARGRRRPRRREGRRPRHDRARARRAEGRSGRRRRARARPAGGGRAHRRAPRRGAAAAEPGDRGRPRPRPLLLLVRAVPALLGRAEGGRGAGAGDRRPRLRRALPPADPPDRAQEPQGPQQRAHRRPGRSRLAVRDRRRRGRPRRRAPRARHARRRARADAPPPASTGWTSRSTSRSTRPPTTRG